MITLLQAATGAAQQGGNWTFWVMIAAMIAIMYFFMWRPEQKRRKEMQKFREGLKSGDKVITAGGIYAVVKKVEAQFQHPDGLAPHARNLSSQRSHAL